VKYLTDWHGIAALGSIYWLEDGVQAADDGTTRLLFLGWLNEIKTIMSSTKHIYSIADNHLKLSWSALTACTNSAQTSNSNC
jgi:hypothetical protein